MNTFHPPPYMPPQQEYMYPTPNLPPQFYPTWGMPTGPMAPNNFMMGGAVPHMGHPGPNMGNGMRSVVQQPNMRAKFDNNKKKNNNNMMNEKKMNGGGADSNTMMMDEGMEKQDPYKKFKRDDMMVETSLTTADSFNHRQQQMEIEASSGNAPTNHATTYYNSSQYNNANAGGAGASHNKNKKEKDENHVYDHNLPYANNDKSLERTDKKNSNKEMMMMGMGMMDSHNHNDEKRPLKTAVHQNKEKADNGSWVTKGYIQGFISHNIKKEKSYDSDHKPMRLEKVKDGSSKDRKHK
jgi:hypothetical protein